MESDADDIDAGEDIGAEKSNIINISDTFSSYEEFEAKLELHCEETNAVFTVRNSKLVSTVNAGLKGEKYNESLKYSYALIACKHFGTVRSKSTGARPNQSTFKIECPVYIHLKAERKRQLLYIDKMEMEHNHILDPQLTKYYPENRGLDEGNLEEAAQLIKLRVKPSILLDELRKRTGKAIIGQDLVNARRHLESRERGDLSETEDLLKYLDGLVEQGDSVLVATNEASEIEYIFLMHPSMKEAFEKFPEVIILDSTYCTNKSKLPLLILECMNGLGAGEPVAYAFVVHESKNTLSDVLKTFKDHVSETSFNKLKSVVVDKSMSEIGALREIIPNARIQLCSFHVQNVFKGVTKTEPNRDAIREHLQDMIYAQTDKAFNKHCRDMKSLASEEFCDYFKDNWEDCQEAWSRNQKIVTSNFGNDTTNRVESLNQKFKLIVDRSGTIKAAIEDFHLLMRNKTNLMDYKRYLLCAKQQYTVNESDPMVKQVQDDCTQFASDLIRKELAEAKKPAVRIIYQTTQDSCSCYFSRNLLMPCRHMMRVRVEQGLPVYAKELVGERWLKAYNLQYKTTIVATSQEGVIHQKLPACIKPKGKQEKFKRGLTLAGQFADLLSVCGQRLFEERSQLLKDLINKWKANEEVFLVSKFTAVENADQEMREQEIQGNVTQTPKSKPTENADQEMREQEIQDNGTQTPKSKPVNCTDSDSSIESTTKPTKKKKVKAIADSDFSEASSGHEDTSETMSTKQTTSNSEENKSSKNGKSSEEIDNTQTMNDEIVETLQDTSETMSRKQTTSNGEENVSSKNGESSEEIDKTQTMNDDIVEYLDNDAGTEDNTATVNNVSLPVFKPRGRPPADKKKYTVIGTLRKDPPDWKKSTTLPPVVKIIGKPKDHNRTVFSYKNSSSKIKFSNKGKGKGKSKSVLNLSEDEDGNLTEKEDNEDNDQEQSVESSGSHAETKAESRVGSCFDCKGDLPLVRTTCKSGKNQGRDFYMCTAQMTDKCSKKRGFRHWVAKNPQTPVKNTTIKNFFTVTPVKGKESQNNEAIKFDTNPLEDEQLVQLTSAVDSGRNSCPSDTLRCCSCLMEVGGAHKCNSCNKCVHAIPPCSGPAPGASEGFGKPRTCSKCMSSQKSCSKRVGEPSQAGNAKKTKRPLFSEEIRNQTQTPPKSRTGRIIKQKMVFSP